MATTIVFFERGGRPVGFKATGHADHSEHGTDVVCAGISVTVLGAVAAFINILDLKDGDYNLINESGNVHFEILSDKFGSISREVIFATLYTQMMNLKASYPDNVVVENVEMGD